MLGDQLAAGRRLGKEVALAEQHFATKSEEHRKQVAEARRQTGEIVAQGHKDAERIVEEAKDQARLEAEKLLEQSRRQIEQETRSAMAQVRGTVADLALNAAGKLLSRSVDTPDQRQLVEEYVKDLEGQAGR